MTAPVIDIRGLVTRFGNHLVHEGLDLSIPAGEVMALVGGSGSGKTTLLRQVIGLMRPQRGDIRVLGQPLFSGDLQADRALRQRFGMLFQQGALFSALNVLENIAFPLRELRWLDRETIHDLVMIKLAMVELEPRHAWLMPAELSGGMVKRVALARALALEPELLLLDEPTAGLDPDRSAAFVSLIRRLRDQLGLSVVLVTHDLDTLSALATRVAVLGERRILAEGTLDHVMKQDHPFIRSFFGAARPAAGGR
ncbi:ABC transporter ATP-binding protein [Methyloversatilis universalis]|uniref:ABC transporter ATP-binding protein n=1 Tax=Methyloversatilis universalis TaxID=378211 RepID=UPI00037CB386|nr:ATP-binding cassette domain-containing protein [Methyloversatilis universalis]